MRASPRRSRPPTLALLLGVALAVLASGAGSAAGQEPAPEAPAAPAAIDLVARPPWARPVDELAFSVRTAGDPATTSVQVEVFSALDSVDELEESATEDVGVRLSRTPPVPVAELPPGPDGTRTVPLRIAADPVDDTTTQIVAPGVHPVVISLLGAGGEVLDEIRTPVVRLGEEEDPWEAPDLAVLLDADASPTLQPDGTRVISATELRRLARTAELLAAHPDLGLSVAAVPDTVEALAAVPDPAAVAVVEALAGADLLAAPYLPLPVAELVDQGLDGLVPPLAARGADVLFDRLGAEPRPGVWSGTHPTGERGGRLLADLGYERVVVPAPLDDDLDEDELAPLADSGPVPVDGAGPLLGLLADPTLSSELASPLPQRPDAAHVVLARYLLRPAEDDPADTTDDRDDDGPQDTATVLVRPGPLAPDSELAGLLALLDDPQAPVRVGGLDLVDDEADELDGDEAPDPVEWESEPTPSLDEVARAVLAHAGRLDSFAAMVADRTPVADDLRLQVATAIATGTEPAARVAAVEAVDEALATSFDAVHLTGQTDLNLTSRRGTLPVTIENLNSFSVDVLVRVRSDRLRLPEGEAFPVTVAEGEQRRIDIPVEARATGSVPVFVEVWTPDDDLALDDLRLNVRSTAVSGVGLVISAGAILVLVTWWVRHVRAVRRERAADPTDPEMG